MAKKAQELIVGTRGFNTEVVKPETAVLVIDKGARKAYTVLIEKVTNEAIHGHRINLGYAGGTCAVTVTLAEIDAKAKAVQVLYPAEVPPVR